MVTIADVVEAYNAAKVKFYPRHTYPVSNYPKWWRQLAMLLDKEKVDPAQYFFWVFGILDEKQRPPLPNKLADPILIAKFKQMRV